MNRLTLLGARDGSSPNRAGYAVPAVNVLYKLPAPAAVRRTLRDAHDVIAAMREAFGKSGVEYAIRSALLGLAMSRASSRADVVALRAWAADVAETETDAWLEEHAAA
ncbi:hypothetical protein [Promicromonospora sp. NFX87]|uniref:hypothetical protein n=1 Tax=Promicromonospora sp. NFX87 TaxID=3402691 RepID=UPI003AFA8A86